MPIPGDRNVDDVSLVQCEVGGRNNAGARHQKRSVGEGVVATKPLHQVLEGAGHLTGGSLLVKHDLATPHDLQIDFDLGDRGKRRIEGDPGTEPSALVVALGLRQVERILPFDVARAHVVAHREADDSQLGGKHQRDFRFGHVPGRILRRILSGWRCPLTRCGFALKNSSGRSAL